MEFHSLEWHDYWRLGIFAIASACLFLLGSQFVRLRKKWGERTRDRWFAMVMWCLAAWEMQLEGLVRDTPLRFRLVFVTAAILITLKLLTKKKDRWVEFDAA